jgi:signal transduction histidine kinase
MGPCHLIVTIIFIALLATAGCLSMPGDGGNKNLTISTSPTTVSMVPAGTQVITTTPAGPGTSQTPGSSNVTDLVGFVENAIVYSQRVGKEKAIVEFASQNGSFTRGEQYIWAYDFGGINLAHPYHPEYKGQNKLSLTDDAGVRMIEAMRDAARNGSGFVSYQFANPVTGKTEPKLAYVKRVDDTWWLASGIYGTNLSIPAQTPEMVREILISKVSRAANYTREVGKDEALVAFNNESGPFASGGPYIFAFDMNGTTLAMPFRQDLIGVNERNLTDINSVSIGEEKIRVAGHGGGFFYYVYNNPADSGKSEFKISYIEPAGTGWVTGAGIYLPDVQARFSEERRKLLVARVRDAVAEVHKTGRDAAISTFNNPDGPFSDRSMFIFAFDRNGTQLANPYLPGLLGLNRLADRDRYGSYPVQGLIEHATAGGGFTYYFFADPAVNYSIRLKLGYTEITGNDLVVGAGIFPDQ